MAAVDTFQSPGGAPREHQGITQPGTKLFAITKHDTNELAYVTRGIWVGGAGNIAILAVDDSDAVTLVGVAAGTLIPIRAKKVMSTNTTATSIVGIV